MLQILLYHCFRHLAYRGTKLPSRPRMPAPVLLFQVRKFFKQLVRCAPFDSSHNLAWRHVRRTTHENVYVIFTHNTFDDPDFKGFACFSHQVANPLRHLSIQHLVAILRYPYKVVLNLKHLLVIFLKRVLHTVVRYLIINHKV